jgi:ribose 5-phosphate isomerase
LAHWPLPVVELEFGWCPQMRFLERLGAEIVPRMRYDDFFHTDQGNMILDSRFGPIADPAALSAAGRAGRYYRTWAVLLVSPTACSSPVRTA